MSKTISTTAAALVFSLISGASIAAEMGPEERAIRKEAQGFADAYNQGKAEAVAAQWTKDGEYTIGQQTVKGRDAIAKLYGEFLGADLGSKMEVKVGSVRARAATGAIEEGTPQS